MSGTWKYVIAAAVTTTGIIANPLVADVFSVDPLATYLRTNNDSGALDAVPISLESIGITPGTWIQLKEHGDWRPGTVGTDSLTMVVAVFSASDILLPSNELNRVQDAIDAGTDFTTMNTYDGDLLTDIPEDFFLDNVYIQVPVGATHIFLTVHDRLFQDNSDPDGDHAVEITVTGGCCLPDQTCIAPISQPDCEAQNGAYAGDGTRCACWGSVPVVSSLGLLLMAAAITGLGVLVVRRPQLQAAA